MLASSACDPSLLLLLSTPVAEREDAKAALDIVKDSICPSSRICDNCTATPNLPTNSLSPPSIVDSDLSQSSVGTEHTKDHPLPPLHGKYDIV